jgi:hypothetical protein
MHSSFIRKLLTSLADVNADSSESQRVFLESVVLGVYESCLHSSNFSSAQHIPIGLFFFDHKLCRWSSAFDKFQYTQLCDNSCLAVLGTNPQMCRSKHFFLWKIKYETWIAHTIARTANLVLAEHWHRLRRRADSSAACFARQAMSCPCPCPCPYVAPIL